ACRNSFCYWVFFNLVQRLLVDRRLAFKRRGCCCHHYDAVSHASAAILQGRIRPKLWDPNSLCPRRGRNSYLCLPRACCLVVYKGICRQVACWASRQVPKVVPRACNSDVSIAVRGNRGCCLGSRLRNPWQNDFFH